MTRSRWALLTVVVGVAVGIGLSERPWKEFRRLHDDSQEAVGEARDLERERAELLHDASRLDNAYGMEEVARGRGYRKPDERPLVVGE